MPVCYRRYNQNSIQIVPGFTPCPGSKSAAGFMSCCAEGSACLENGICYHPNPSAGQSGFYMATCTDPAYDDPVCPLQCINLFKGDIVYDSSSNLWNCCGQTNNSNPNAAVSCHQPTEEKFQELPPAQLLLQTNTTSSSSIASSSSTTLATSLPSASSTATGILVPSRSNSHLSTSALVGLSIGSTIGILAITATVVVFARRRSRRTQQAERLELSAEPYGGLPKISELSSHASLYSTTTSTPVSENTIYHEMDSDYAPTKCEELATPC